MNKLKTAVAAILIAGGTLAAFAFSPAQTETKTEATVYYWFEEGSNNYLGQDTKANIQSDHCGPEGMQPCARAYSSISGGPGNEVPVGSQQDLATKQ